jgi:hypothetical protein
VQTRDMAEKIRVLFDGVEVAGLVKYPGFLLEEGIIEVPEFGKIRIITNGIVKIVPLELVYKIARDTNTLAYFRSYMENKEVHDVTIIRCDRDGKEFGRILMPSTECNKLGDPPFDGAAPTYAQITVGLVPWDIIRIAAEA